MLVGDELQQRFTSFMHCSQVLFFLTGIRHHPLSERRSTSHFSLQALSLRFTMRTTQEVYCTPLLSAQPMDGDGQSSISCHPVNVLDVNFQVVPLILILHEKLYPFERTVWKTFEFANAYVVVTGDSLVLKGHRSSKSD